MTPSGRIWKIGKYVLTGSAGALAALAALAAIEQWTKKPQIYLAWYTEGSSEVLSLTKEPTIHVTLEDLEENKVRWPIRLALRNEGNKTARSAQLDVAYPADLEVISRALPSIRPGEASKVFRHDVGDLVPSRDFTPVSPFDVLVIPVTVGTTEAVVVSSDGLPISIFFLSLYFRS